MTEVVDRYVAVWQEPDPQRRRQAIAEIWTADGTEFIEGTRFRGPAELDARVGEAYRQFVAGGQYEVSAADDVTVHGDMVMFTIQLVSAGEVAWAAQVFLLLDGDGRVREDYHLTVQPLAS